MNADQQKKHQSHLLKSRKPAIKSAKTCETKRLFIDSIVRLLQYNFLVFCFCHTNHVNSKSDHTQSFYRDFDLQKGFC